MAAPAPAPVARKSPVASIRRKADEMVKAATSKARKVRQEARDDTRKALLVGFVEAPVGGALAGALDGATDPLFGLVPWSLPAGMVTSAVGYMADQHDVARIGAGMLAGSAYGLTEAIVSTLFGKA